MELVPMLDNYDTPVIFNSNRGTAEGCVSSDMVHGLERCASG